MRRIAYFRRALLIGLAAGLLAWCGALPAARAMYIQPDLQEVSVNRLITNVAKQLEAKPNDADLWFRLARLHAMAYASKSDTATVNRAVREERPWFGYEPRYVPYELKTTKDAAQLKEARRHLGLAVEMHEKVLKLKPDDAVVRLGYAWCLQQAGKTEEAVEQYRKTIEQAWKKEKDLELGGLGGHYVVAEAAGYLVPLLDKEKDAPEIATLQQRAEKLTSLPRPITPIAVPLRDGLNARDLVDRQAAVAFDADGSGLPRRWTWITPDAAWLVTDIHDRRQVRSALQMFGSVSFWLFWDNGYQALSALDDDGDGRLAGDELRGLALWRDANSNGVSDPGEVRPLADWGIVTLGCRHQTDAADPERIAFSPRGVTFRDGTTRPTFDVILQPRAH